MFPRWCSATIPTGCGRKHMDDASQSVANFVTKGGDKVRFVRVGTLDAPDHLPPDIHIFISSKQPWVVLPPETPAFADYYRADEIWPAERLARRKALIGK